MKRPRVVGLIGGVASGKSLVAKLLLEHGAAVISADAIGHQLLIDPAVQDELVAEFGKEILDVAGNVDRSRLATIVFGYEGESNRQRKRLEAILHPRIRRCAEEQLGRQIQETNCSMIVLDAPLLIEADWQSLCDQIIFVDTPLERRIEFAGSRGWDKDELLRREANQLPLEQKRKAANLVIPNHGSLNELRAQVTKLVDSITHR